MKAHSQFSLRLQRFFIAKVNEHNEKGKLQACHSLEHGCKCSPQSFRKPSGWCGGWGRKIIRSSSAWATKPTRNQSGLYKTLFENFFQRLSKLFIRVYGIQVYMCVYVYIHPYIYGISICMYEYTYTFVFIIVLKMVITNVRSGRLIQHLQSPESLGFIIFTS